MHTHSGLRADHHQVYHTHLVKLYTLLPTAMPYISKLNPFAKKETEEQRATRIAAEQKNEALEREKKKAEIMKYRGYTEEQAEAHLAQREDGMNTERGLRALGTALAPQRLST